ncbi:MAG: HPr kinase/phosphatase C-terminal domain-containing protein [Mesorhizobium sp.]|nr:HPr kinase/phosphatase C-terminal domain-containing protein [Mesorhizobium sp.]
MSASTPDGGSSAPRAGATNHHATAIVLGDRGVLITGASGSGKSALALHLIAEWRLAGRFARLVADDQVYMAARADRLVAHAPPTIAGLVEARGHGPAPIDHEPAAVIDLVVDLVAEAEVARLQAGATCAIAGVEAASLHLSCRNVMAASFAVNAALGGIPFAPGGGNGTNLLAGDNDLGLSTRVGRTT